jgi:uroporphyrinogen-III synthase
MPEPASAGPLRDAGIVVTRPGLQAAAFAARIAAIGGRPIVFPAIVILPPEDRTALDDVHRRLATYDFAVFVSANAVEYGLPQGGWPRRVRAVAPGPGTAAALLLRHVPEPLVPAERFDSEGMLALPELADVAGRRIVVFRGNGGRELMADELAKRGAVVEQVECYRRAKPQTGSSGLIEAWRERRIDAVTITSSEGLANLWELLDAEGRAFLRGTPLFALHARIAAAARALGCGQVHETRPGDAGLIAGLLAHFEKAPSTEPGERPT